MNFWILSSRMARTRRDLANNSDKNQKFEKDMRQKIRLKNRISLLAFRTLDVNAKKLQNLFSCFLFSYPKHMKFNGPFPLFYLVFFLYSSEKTQKICLVKLVFLVFLVSCCFLIWKMNAKFSEFLNCCCRFPASGPPLSLWSLIWKMCRSKYIVVFSSI